MSKNKNKDKSKTKAKKPYALFKPPNSNRWSVRFSIKGQGQQRITLGTESKKEAKRLALKKWSGAVELAEMGLSVTQKTFPVIAQEFIDKIAYDVKHGDKEPYHKKQFPPIINRYFIGFFGTKKFTAINASDIEDYWQWRIDYWDSGDGAKEPFIRYTRTINGRATNIKRPVKEGRPSNSTLDKEAGLLKQLFAFGQRQGYILETPPIKSPRTKKRTLKAKPGFTLDEFNYLRKISENRVDEYDDEISSERIYHDRIKLHCYCMIAGYTGMRPTELKNLDWGAIGKRDGGKFNGINCSSLTMQASGKGKEREFIPMPECETYLTLLKELFLLQVHRYPTSADPVFFRNDGTRIMSFKKGLASLLIAAGLRQVTDGRLRDSGSFRPFYISQQIREGVSRDILIRNTGTSGKMVNDHYNKIRPSEEISQLTPDWGNSRALTIKMNKR